MENNNKSIVDFELPEDSSLIDAIYEILEDNGLGHPQDAREWPEEEEEEPRAIIIRDAAVIIFKKTISEEKLVEFLQKHLKISVEVAKKIIIDIKAKLIPYAKEVSTTEDESMLSTQEILLRKIKDHDLVKKSPASFVEKTKDIEVKNVEKNAENMGKEGRNIITKEKESTLAENLREIKKENLQKQESKPDDAYREPVD